MENTQSVRSLCVSRSEAKLYIEVCYSNIPTTLNIVTGKCIRKHKSLKIKYESSSVLTLTLFCTQHILVIYCGLCLDCGTHGTAVISPSMERSIFSMSVSGRNVISNTEQEVRRAMENFFYSITIKIKCPHKKNLQEPCKMWLFIMSEYFFYKLKMMVWAKWDSLLRVSLTCDTLHA